MFRLIHGECLEEMDKLIKEGITVDAIITDPPYGTTACSWDTVIPFEPMWKRLNKLIKPNGAIVLFGSEPFSSALRMSNIKRYKYDWVWVKERGIGFQIAKYRPMMRTELISVFCNKTLCYYPIMKLRDAPIRYNYPKIKSESSPIANYNQKQVISEYKYPENTLFFNIETGDHPTQKPVALIRYLIKTYTLEGETVLDFTMGSGTTGVACLQSHRNFIGIEIEEKYFKIAQKRINNNRGLLYDV